ncbi:hypothetical protein [Halorussus salinus]|uniref:hypothetical protein n=1 Tax=Halorussus salinus TaxID=1364935 RepID=UPI001092822E|nr:hypothetical protein [Halorussus salinus]
MGVEWRLRRVNDGVADDALLDVEVTDAYNRFARQATAVLDDPDGAKAEEYPQPTPVELDVRRDGEQFRQRFGGFVINTTTEQDATTLEILSHDFWLRKRQVFRAFDGDGIESVLKLLITDLTPLDWADGAEVEVVNDEPVGRDWKGERLDEVVAELAAKSAGEDFGATDEGVFFFRPRDSAANEAPRNFPAGAYDEANFSEDGKREVNKVTLYYGEEQDTGAVSVQDRASQQELADELGRETPVVVGETKTYPEIADATTAEQKARQILNDRSAVLTGTLQTWGAFGVTPGDVTSVVVPEQGVNRDFRVAEITYQWREDRTEIKLAENSDGVLDTLVGLSQEVSRIDSRAADEEATITQIVDLAEQVGVELNLTAYKRAVPDDQLLFGDLKGGWGDPQLSAQEPVSTRFEAFEDGVGDWSGWRLSQDSSHAYDGTQAGKLSSTSATAASKELNPTGTRIDGFDYYYWEPKFNQNGGGVRFQNSDGNWELGTATDNPQFVLDGATTEIDSGDSYAEWVHVDVSFDWDETPSTATATFSYTEHDYEWTATVEMAEGIDVSTIYLAGYGDSWGGGGTTEMWFDGMRYSESPQASGGLWGDQRGPREEIA